MTDLKRLRRVSLLALCLSLVLLSPARAASVSSRPNAVTVELQGLPPLTAPGACIGLNWTVAGGLVCDDTYVRWDVETHAHGEAYPYSSRHYSGGMGNFTDYIDVPLGAESIYLMAYASVDGTLYKSPREYEVRTVRASDSGSSVSSWGTGGVRWYADIGYDDTRFGYVGGSTYSTNRPIAGTEDDAIYQTQRVGMSSYFLKLTRVVYTIDLEVELHLAELEVAASGQRVFDVLLEPGTANEVAITGIDLYDQVGRDTALVLTRAVTVDDNQLDISFVPVSGKPPVVNGVLVRGLQAIGQRGELVTIQGEDDDTYVYNATNYRRSPELLMGGESAYHVGLRFANVQVPQHATINHAELRLTGSRDSYARLDVSIYAEAVADTLDFTMPPQVPSRPRTNASVAWQVGNDDGWHPNETLVSPELRDVIQEIVNRGDWASFDALTLLLIANDGDAGPRGVRASEAGASSRPYLFIEYTAPGAVVPTPSPTRVVTPSITPTATPTVTPTPAFRLSLPLLMRPYYLP